MNRLKELRDSLPFKDDEFAKMIGIHRSTLYRYDGTNVKEPREIPMELAVKISEMFDVSLDWLVGNPNASKYRDQTQSKLSELYNQLSEDYKKELFNYAIYLLNKEVK